MQLTSRLSRQRVEQRAKQEKLQKEQEALPDVRAKSVKVKNVAKVQAVLAPTTVTQIEGTPSVTISATPDASDLVCSDYDDSEQARCIDRPAAGGHGEIGGLSSGSA